MRQAILYDFHGTLVNVTSVRDLLMIRDYDSFYEQSLLCPPIEHMVAETRRTHEEGFVNLLFTGLPDKYASGLNEWLARHSVPIDLIEMRKTGDYRKDFIVKRDMYIRASNQGYYVLHAWDDSPRVADMLKSQGVPVSIVPGWDETLVTGRVDKPSSAS
jgi:hypothetical protein